MNKTALKVIAFGAIGTLVALWAANNLSFVQKAIAAKQ